MKLSELSKFVSTVVEIATRNGYQNALNQFRTAYTQIRNLVKQGQTPQISQQLNQFRLQTQTSKEALLNAIAKIQDEIANLNKLKITHQINIDKFFGSSFLKIVNEINEQNVETYINELTQTYTQFTQLSQLNTIFSSLNVPITEEFEEDSDRLEILFDGAAMVETLKELSLESSKWNQHVNCFSRLARENETDAIINSVEKGSLLLTITLVSGTVIAIMKAVDKILDSMMKFYEVRKKTLELKKLKLSYIDDAINLLDKHEKLNLVREADSITAELLAEYNWTENDELFNETKAATRLATKKIIKFINKGGKVEGYIKEPTEESQKVLMAEVKSKNKIIKEIEIQMKQLSDAKEILLLEDSENDEKDEA